MAASSGGLDGGLEGLMAGLCESNSIHKACHMCVLCSNSDNKCWVIKGTYPARISDVVHRNPWHLDRGPSLLYSIPGLPVAPSSEPVVGVARN